MLELEKVEQKLLNYWKKVRLFMLQPLQVLKWQRLHKRFQKNITLCSIFKWRVWLQKYLCRCPSNDWKKWSRERVEIELENNEKSNFDVSIKAVKELFQSAVKIDPSLGK